MFLESDAMFDTSFDILVVLFFVCFFGVIGYVVVKVVVQWNRNNHSPLETDFTRRSKFHRIM